MEIHKNNIDQLFGRVRREVDDGLLPSVQVALAFGGEIIAEEAYGTVDDRPASLEDRYCFFSATKPMVASVIWQLITEGKIDLHESVVAYFPEFSRADDEWKTAVTVEQVMLHTSGFPLAP